MQHNNCHTDYFVLIRNSITINYTALLHNTVFISFSGSV